MNLSMMIINTKLPPHTHTHKDLESSIGQFSELFDRISTSLFEEMKVTIYTKKVRKNSIVGPEVAGSKIPKILRIMDFRQRGRKQNNTKQTKPGSSEGLNNPILLIK